MSSTLSLHSINLHSTSLAAWLSTIFDTIPREEVIRHTAYYRNKFRISLKDGGDSRPFVSSVSGASNSWRAPSGCIIKINYDAVADCARNRGSVGFVAPNGEGRVLVTRTRVVEQITNPAVLDATALRAAAMFARMNGWSSVILEEDSKNVDAATDKNFTKVFVLSFFI
ncbi:RVT_3 domain-containing protein [Quillaja saponaria]|uniref:RVT_3 domain-containing protein n=1 Tax=Quillaja saponaria TaxID=32244 RepID=A0AAD7QC35_QUISA|nr:RVT_3 domain-containing protein [Quillaja saponaria]